MKVVNARTLELTEEEAHALLNLALMSETALDGTSEKAMTKLAAFCKSHYQYDTSRQNRGEYDEAG